MRKILLALGGVVALAAAAIAALLLFVDADQFRGVVQSSLEKQLRRPVKLGAMGLGLFPLGVRAADIEIGEPAGWATGRPFARAKMIRVRSSLLPLLRKQVKVESLVLVRPEVELVRNASGQWNFSDLTKSSGGSGSGALELARFDVEEGAVAVSDLGNPKSRAVYQPLDLSVTGLAPGATPAVTASVKIAGGGAVRLEGKPASGGFKGKLSVRDASLSGLARLAGSALPADGLLSGAADLESSGDSASASGRFDLGKVTVRGAKSNLPVRLDFAAVYNSATGAARATTLNLAAGNVKVEASGELDRSKNVAARVRIPSGNLADLLSLAALFGDPGIGGAGALTLDASVSGPLSGKLAYTGSGSLRDAKISAPSLAKPVEIKSAVFRLDKNSATVNPVEASLAGSTLRGSLTLRDFSSPDLAFDLDVDRIDTDALAQVSAPSKPGAAPPRASASPAVTAKGTLRAGTLAAQGLVFTGVRAECSFDKGVLKLAPITAAIFGGTHSGSITLDTRANPPALATDLKLDRVDANKLLSAATSVKQVLHGLMAASGDAHLKLAPGDDMVKSLNGSMAIRLSQGKLAGVNLLNQLAAAGKLLGRLDQGPAFTDIVQLTGDVKIVSGVATTDNLQLQIEGASLTAAGTVNLATQALNLKVAATLDPATSRKLGGSSAGNILESVLSGPKGEMVVPVVVSGTFGAMKFTPDAGRLAEMKLKGILSRPASGQASGKTADKPQETPGRKAAGFLDGLLKKKQQ